MSYVHDVSLHILNYMERNGVSKEDTVYGQTLNELSSLSRPSEKSMG